MATDSGPYDVCVIIGSESDLPALEKSKLLAVFAQAEIVFRVDAISAHRHPEILMKFCRDRMEEGTGVFICAASKNAALPGAVVSIVPRAIVIGVALEGTSAIDLVTAFLAETNNPSGTAVLFAGFGSDGFTNAAISACKILGRNHLEIREEIGTYLLETRKPPKFGLYKTQV